MIICLITQYLLKLFTKIKISVFGILNFITLKNKKNKKLILLNNYS